nr:AbfB domain-containing protein [Streptomyces canus]
MHRVVSGLSGTDTVSLESVNFPGHYLRHKNFEVWLEKSDGTTTFKNDASFTQRADLSDTAAGVSFESYNYPGRYIRHHNYLLYVQPAGTTAAKADATFYSQ